MKRLCILLAVLLLTGGCAAPETPTVTPKTTTTTSSAAVTSANETGTTATSSASETTTTITTTTTTTTTTTKKPTSPTKKSATPSATTKTTTKPTTTTSPSTTTTTTTATTTTAPNAETMCQAVFRLVNVEREKAGLPALTYRSDLQVYADTRAVECAKKFSHTRPNGESCFTVLPDDPNNPYYYLGENIAQGQRDAAEVMQDWMNSDGHRGNILNVNFTGIVVGYYNYNWVQLFITQ